MVQVRIYVREIDSLKPDSSFEFSLPDVPRVGDYISIERPDAAPWTEDVVVRKIWWRLRHGETRSATPQDDPINGRVLEIEIDCEPAIGPTCTDRWLNDLEAAERRGVAVERFQVARLNVRQSDLGK